MDSAATTNGLRMVAACTDPAKLEIIARNARTGGDEMVERAAFLKLCAIVPAHKEGTFENDVWQSINALEGALKRERGKTSRLVRTRDKIKRLGEHRTVADLMQAAPSDGYAMLIERAMPERTFEAVVLRHRARFEADAIAIAQQRLAASGVEGVEVEGAGVPA